MPRIGMLTPSSNTVLEPVSAALAQSLSGVTLHFGRFRVTRIGLDAAALGQFDDEPMLAAADLLADARVDCITWNGTSASWLGLDSDRRIVAAIEQRTAIRATTTVLRIVAILRERGISRIGLVTPYTQDVQQRIAECLGAEGLHVVAEAHAGISDNFAFAEVGEDRLDAMAAAVVQPRPEAIVVLCTNLAGAFRAPAWEERYRIPVLDSVAVGLQGALERIGADTAPLLRYGRLLG
jgi:maleate isomerase